MSALVESLSALAQPWADLYADSAAVHGAVAFAHLAGLLGAGGLALASDRAVLRAARAPAPERGPLLRELAAVHAPVLAGLALVVASGVAMLLADVEALLPSPLFWAKMGLFVLLLWNGALLRGAGRAFASSAASVETESVGGGEGDERRWRRLRAASVRSAVLWFAVLLLGTLLTTYA